MAEELDEAAPADAVVPGTAADATTTDEAATPISKLNEGQQFLVLQKLWQADARHTSKWRKNAKDWFAFRAGEQWTPEDKQLLDAQERPHIVFNRVLTILKAVAGMEINGRHEIAFKPRGIEDTAVNEVLTGASKWMSDETDGEDEESQAFDDCATCGIGVAESRLSYEDNPAGMYVEDQVFPLEFGWDRSATKKGLKNARRMWRVRRMPLGDAMAMFPGKNRLQLDAAWADDLMADEATRGIEEKRIRDRDNAEEYQPFDETREVTLVQMQWIEREVYWIVADIQTNTKVDMTDAQYKTFCERMKLLGMDVHAARMTRKVYKQAFLGSEVLKSGDAPIKGKFSWDVITGEYDSADRTWFGLVKVMRDPQMWANKWLSQILHILNSTAKGGILAEQDAFDNETEAEESYARQERITWVANGSLSGQKPKIMPKPGAGDVSAYLGLMTFAISSVKDVTGINLELLGQQDQNQPGILEAMRKQAGMTVLATLFDSLRRFRKGVAKSRLYFIQNFLSDGRLIRITGEEGEKVIPLIRDQTTGEFDVVVDDTPTSPNQKEANWQIIQPMLAIFKDQLMAQPKVFAMLLEYSPLPARIVSAIKGFIEDAENNPEAQQKAQRNDEIQVAAAMAAIAKDQAAADLNKAKAGGVQATAMYDIAMARNMMEDNDREGLRAWFDQQEAKAKADKAQAEAAKSHAGAQREMAAIGADRHKQVIEAQKLGLESEKVGLAVRKAGTEHHKAVVGGMIDHLTATAKAERDMAAARKDHVIAARELRTPIPSPAESR